MKRESRCPSVPEERLPLLGSEEDDPGVMWRSAEWKSMAKATNVFILKKFLGRELGPKERESRDQLQSLFVTARYCKISPVDTGGILQPLLVLCTGLFALETIVFLCAMTVLWGIRFGRLDGLTLSVTSERLYALLEYRG